MPRRLKNIRPWKGKWQAYTEVGGTPKAKSFALTTPVQEMRDWLAAIKKKHARPLSIDGSFGADIETYKQRIAALPTFKQKAAHLELWARALGRDRPRRTITATELDALMQTWLLTLDPQTVRKRRTSLLSLFVTLDGKAAENAVRATKNPKPPNPEIRGTDYATIGRILAAMPTHKDTLKGQPTKLSLTKLRVAVLAYTGLPPGMLAAVKPADVNLAARTVRVGKRTKGAGVEARTLPLTPQGVAAFTALLAAGPLTSFAVGPLNVSFKRACARAGVSGLTIYDLRHSFGAQMYRTTRDEKTVARFLLHAEGSTQTARYRKAADAEVDRAAATAFGTGLGQDDPKTMGRKGTQRDARPQLVKRRKLA